ncbi:MAG: YitT family protein, partial [Armatimonadota bacterium]|nr:YitT family protein [Armatimonadota bacterium]
LGLVFRSRGTTGGSDLAAQLVRLHSRVSVGQALVFIDGAVTVLAGVVFGMELALYGLLSLFVTGWVVDLVQEGGGYVKAALIISERTPDIAQEILHGLNRGATVLRGRGAYTGRERDILVCVVSRSELTRLKELVRGIDPAAFVIVSTVHEVLGEGFKSMVEEER